MAYFQQSFEAGSAGAITTTNPPTSGYDTAFNNPGTVSGTGAIALMTGDASHGNNCLSATQTTTASSSALARLSGLTDTSFAFSCYIKLPVLSSSGAQTIIRAYDSNAARFLSVNVKIANSLFLAFTNSDTVVWQAVNTLTANVWYRVECTVNTVGTASTVTFNYYVGDSTTPVETGYSASGVLTTSTGSTTIADIRFGKNSCVSTAEVRYDSIKYSTGSIPLGPWGANVSSGTANVNFAGTADSSAPVAGTATVNFAGTALGTVAVNANATVNFAATATSTSPISATATVNFAGTGVAGNPVSGSATVTFAGTASGSGASSAVATVNFAGTTVVGTTASGNATITFTAIVSARAIGSGVANVNFAGSAPAGASSGSGSATITFTAGGTLGSIVRVVQIRKAGVLVTASVNRRVSGSIVSATLKLRLGGSL